jgi:hypothetical protein
MGISDSSERRPRVDGGVLEQQQQVAELALLHPRPQAFCISTAAVYSISPR